MSAEQKEVIPPEQSISSLIARVRTQALYDALLICAPPFLLIVYASGSIHRLGFVSTISVLLAAGIALAVLTAGALLIYRPKVPSTRLAARLLDEKTEANDRFVTLATVNPQSSPPLLM